MNPLGAERRTRTRVDQIQILKPPISVPSAKHYQLSLEHVGAVRTPRGGRCADDQGMRPRSRLDIQYGPKR